MADLVSDFEDAVLDYERDNSRYNRQEVREQREKLTTTFADMLALIKDLQARGLTTTEDHERVMSIIERAGG